MIEHLLSTKEAARYLGVSTSFLERDRWAGAKIPFIKIGNRAIRYKYEDLESFIESRIERTSNTSAASAVGGRS